MNCDRKSMKQCDQKIILEDSFNESMEFPQSGKNLCVSVYLMKILLSEK